MSVSFSIMYFTGCLPELPGHLQCHHWLSTRSPKIIRILFQLQQIRQGRRVTLAISYNGSGHETVTTTTSWPDPFYFRHSGTGEALSISGWAEDLGVLLCIRMSILHFTWNDISTWHSDMSNLCYIDNHIWQHLANYSAWLSRIAYANIYIVFGFVIKQKETGFAWETFKIKSPICNVWSHIIDYHS